MPENTMPTSEASDNDEPESHSEGENSVSHSDVAESNDEGETKSSDNDAPELSGEEEPQDSESGLLESNDEEDDDKSSDDDSNEEVASENENTESIGANAGWADSIAKILKTNKAKGKTAIVLSKAKKLSNLKVKVKREREAGFEVESKDGKIKKEMIEESDSDESEEPLRKRRRDLPSARVKPNILEKDRERRLLKIATKGVVQLFNAVKKQQKDIDEKLDEAGPVDAKREKVLKNLDKNEFLNVLRGDNKGDSSLNTTIVETNADKLLKDDRKSAKVTWNVLRDDFMMDANMKDWDKSLEEEDEEVEESDIEMA